jgi:hypothetical protein
MTSQSNRITAGCKQPVCHLGCCLLPLCRMRLKLSAIDAFMSQIRTSGVIYSLIIHSFWFWIWTSLLEYQPYSPELAPNSLGSFPNAFKRMLQEMQDNLAGRPQWWVIQRRAALSQLPPSSLPEVRSRKMGPGKWAGWGGVSTRTSHEWVTWMKR